jgi:iron-sulfur cluster repair protein YtfE (RIC family)
MMPVSQELTPLFLSHEDLEPALEDLSALCAMLDLDPHQEDALSTLDAAWQDIRPRLTDHMRAEEQWIFPAVAAMGAPRPLVTSLMTAHERLRRAADRCTEEGATDPRLVASFVRHFTAHVEYEERSLAHFYARC